MNKKWLIIGTTILCGLPGIILRITAVHADPVLLALAFGVSILAAAFLLGWSLETAELDIPQGLAVALIALIAVLPEYAVDAVLAFKTGADPLGKEASEGLAIANMTGANRLLIGLAWPLVFLVFALKSKSWKLIISRERSLELVFLAFATIYVLFLPLRSSVTLVDTIVLISLFTMYILMTIRSSNEEEHELIGPAEAIGKLTTLPRRLVIIIIMAFSAAVIFASAEPFAEGLVETGTKLGVSEFLLIQWIAPLASEAPEVILAIMLTLRGRASVAMGALISSKVNQWTLLIGTLPIAWAFGSGNWSLLGGLPLDGRQQQEIFLTAAQSAFAIAVFLNLRLEKSEALALFLLFGTQLFIPHAEVRIGFGVAYLLLCALLTIKHRKDIPKLFQSAWETVRGTKDSSINYS
jgi:cation:H+ antiporter